MAGGLAPKQRHNPIPAHRRSAGLLCAALLAACSSQPPIPPLPLESAPPFSESGEAALAEPWWTALDDPQLNRRIEQTLQDNFSLASAWQRLQASRALIAQARAELFPQVNAFVSAENIDRTQQQEEQLQLGLEASYEVDLWGHLDDLADAERFRARAQMADYRTLALSLSAEVALAWYRLVAAKSQLDLLADQVEANQAVLRLLEARFGVGQVRSADILRQRQLIESTRAQMISVQARAEVLQHQLAVLQGEPPQRERAAAATHALPALPPLPKTGLPADLVTRRPDVLQAYYLLQAADRELAAAISNQFPRLTLSARAFTAAESASGLFEQWLYSVGGNLLAPLFDAGRLEAEVSRAEAQRLELLYLYGQTTLEAFEEVENALAREANQRLRLDNITARLEMAQDTVELLQTGYLNGVNDYVAVLIGLTEQQQLRRDLLTAHLQLVEYRIALYRALAGGFDVSRRVQGASTANEED